MPDPRTETSRAQRSRRPIHGIRRVDAVVGIYVAASVLWIVLSSILAEDIAGATSLPVTAVEIGKGIAFVLATGLVLRAALRRWAQWIDDAADAEMRAAHELSEAARLRTRFLQSVSHELRTPLTSIVGYGATIRKHGGQLEPARLEHLADRLVVNASRLQQLVLDLLDVERLMRGDQRADLEPVRLDLLVRSVVERTPVDGQVLQLAVEEVEARLDRVRTERLVDELVRNAIRHTPAGTRVEVRVGVDGHFASVVVADDGPGLDPDLQDAIFEPFTQGSVADASHSPGIGIGLTLVRRYAELHGGRVILESSPGVGTRCEVRLPLAGPPPSDESDLSPP